MKNLKRTKKFSVKSFLQSSMCVALLFVAISCWSKTSRRLGTSTENLTQYVDPYIGTGGHGHVFLGANVPYGLVQLGPTQLTHGWDWCSGYHYSDSTIVGFSHMHLSGTGIGDLGDVSFMPVVGDVNLTKGNLSDPQGGFFSLFSHDKETAKPGYYSVHLDKYDVDVELTATQRVGFHKYTFPKSSDPKIIIDLANGIGWDMSIDAEIKQENDSVISGYRYSQGWAKDQRVYFTAIFSKPITSFAIKDTTVIVSIEGKTTKNRQVIALVSFPPTIEKEAIYCKVALSPVSVANAKENMQAELPGWNFEKTIKAADESWNEQLAKIFVKSENRIDLKNFYTALYHTMIAPSVFSDVNGDYFGSDKKNHTGNKNFINYTTFSLWDTYRAAQPLMTIIHPDVAKDVAKTFMNIYKEQGQLPVWHLMGNETFTMVGNSGVIALADLVSKGYVSDDDKEAAYDALKNSTLFQDRGIDLIDQYGYIPADKRAESVASALEYAIADWSVAQIAKQLGKQDDYEMFMKRGQGYAKYFDKSSGFMRGVNTDGKFREPFNPFHATHREDDYCEGNGWQYTWLVPHDVNGLIDLFGSEEAFITKLDSLFVVTGDMGAEASPDISGLIGQYAHGNEPSHHVLYLYPYVGQPWKTADKVREVLTTLYFNDPNGLSGNEDVGQMSAWYVMSAMGFYPMEPVGGDYVFGSPLMNEAVINVGKGKKFEIVAHNNSKENKYIQSAKLNGQPYTKTYINHNEIMKGGKLEFEMGSTPSTTFGVAQIDRPKSKK